MMMVSSSSDLLKIRLCALSSAFHCAASNVAFIYEFNGMKKLWSAAFLLLLLSILMKKGKKKDISRAIGGEGQQSRQRDGQQDSIIIAIGPN